LLCANDEWAVEILIIGSQHAGSFFILEKSKIYFVSFVPIAIGILLSFRCIALLYCNNSIQLF